VGCIGGRFFVLGNEVRERDEARAHSDLDHGPRVAVSFLTF
jgi:hypothetical protein